MGTEPPTLGVVPHPVPLPAMPSSREARDVLAWCEQCGRETSTVYLQLRSGLVGNCCRECRRCRKFKPYAPRHVLTDITHNAASAAQGAWNERSHC